MWIFRSPSEPPHDLHHQPLPSQSLTIAAASAPQQQPATAPEPPFRLKAVTEADWRRLGSGCACTFSLSLRGSDLLIAGGDDVAIFRPNGSQRVCALQEEHLQAMFDGDARIDCGAARLLLKAYGEATPGFDGHSSAAKLTVLYDGSERVFDGQLGCAC